MSDALALKLYELKGCVDTVNDVSDLEESVAHEYIEKVSKLVNEAVNLINQNNGIEE